MTPQEYRTIPGVWLEVTPAQGKVVDLYAAIDGKRTWVGVLWARVLADAGLENENAPLIRLSVSGESEAAT